MRTTKEDVEDAKWRRRERVLAKKDAMNQAR